jgi:hypothetical protein
MYVCSSRHLIINDDSIVVYCNFVVMDFFFNFEAKFEKFKEGRFFKKIKGLK